MKQIAIQPRQSPVLSFHKDSKSDQALLLSTHRFEDRDRGRIGLLKCNGFRSFTDHCVAGIEANEKRLKAYVEKSAGVITAVNPHLGYEAAARIAREAILTGQSLFSTYAFKRFSFASIPATQ